MTTQQRSYISLFFFVSALLIHACSKNSSSTDPRDTVNPAIASVSPTESAVRVATNAAIVIHFTENISPSSVSGTSITVVPSLSGTTTVAADSIVFTPSSAMNFATSYTVTVANDITDLAGNPFSTGFTWSFSTKANTWLRTFTSHGTRLTYGGRVLLTPDHGFIIAGGSCFRVDSLGDTMWERADISAYDIALANDGNGYLVLSGPFDDTSTPPPTLVRIDANGQTLWETVVPARTTATKLCANPLQNCYFLIGIGTDSFVTATNVMKVSNTGGIIWEQWYRGSTGDGFYGHAIHMNVGGDMLIAGEQAFSGLTELSRYIVQIEPTSGTVLWDMDYSAPGGSSVRIYSISTDVAGGMVTSGYFRPGVGNFSAQLELKDLGNTTRQFNRVFTFSGFAEAQYAVPTSDGGFILTGDTYVASTGFRLIIVKTDFQGQEQWRRSLDDALIPISAGVCVAPVSDGGYIILGNGSPDQPTLGILLKVDAEGRY